MLKKLLIAMACAGSAFNVMADTSHCVNGEQVEFNDCTPIYISAQGPVASGKTELDGTALAGNLDGNIRVNLNAEYAAGDTLTLTFTGVTLAYADSVPEAVATGVQNGKMTLGLLSVDEHSVTYRVTELSADGTDPVSTLGAHISFSGLVFNNQELLNTREASVRYTAITSKGQPLDRIEQDSAELFKLVDQFVFLQQELTKIPGYQASMTRYIDVYNDRLSLLSAGPSDSYYNEVKDALITAVVNGRQVTYVQEGNGEYKYRYSTSFKQLATIERVSDVVFGDFGFLGTVNADSSLTSDNISFATYDKNVPDRLSEQTQGVAKYADRLEQSFSPTASNFSDDGLFYFAKILNLADESGKQAAAPLAEQMFSTNLTVTYTDNAGQTHQLQLVDHFPIKVWKYNGSTVHVPFMPFRDDVSPIISVSNTANMDGAISVRVYPDANDSTVVKDYSLPVVAKANAQTDITAALRALNIKGDVALDIIVAAPSTNIAVNALYYSNGDRAVIKTQDRSLPTCAATEYLIGNQCVARDNSVSL